MEMDILSDLMEKISLNSFDLGGSYWVDITHVNNPHSFYVRPTSYRNFMSALKTHSEQIDATQLQINSLVAYLSDKIFDHARGLIVAIDNIDGVIKCDIFAIDYGFFEKSVPIKYIKILMPYNTMVPPLATHCQLAHCKPIDDTFTEKSIDAMICYIGKERAKMVIKEKTSDILIVELINTCPDDVATMLALTGYTTLGYSENKITRFRAPKVERLYFTYKDLKEGDVVHVRVLSGKSWNAFYVAEVKEYKKYLEDRINFSFHCKDQKNVNEEDIKIGKPVGVFVDGTSKYERALVQDIDKNEKKVTVQLVDWGTVTVVHISKIRPILSNFFVHPTVIAIYCSTEESQIRNNGMQKYLSPGYEFKVTVKIVGDNLYAPYIVNVSRLD